MNSWAQSEGQPGLGYIMWREGGEGAGPLANNIGAERTAAIRAQLGVKEGDAAFFVAGALCGAGSMDLWVLNGTLIAAAILGNSVNYSIGRYLGPKVFHWENSRFFNKAALMKTHAFYEQHGGKTLVITRFIPIQRTFAPFVAGIGELT